MSKANALDAVRELHAPVGDHAPECKGCDAEGYETEDPRWPCRTAELVDTADEIATVQATAQKLNQALREAADKRRAERDARIEAGTATQQDREAAEQEAFIRSLFQPMTRPVLGSYIAGEIPDDVALRTISYVMPVSGALLDSVTDASERE